MHAWQLQEAKAHFSEVIKKAVEEGAQNITLRGRPVAVVISEKEYQKLKKPKLSFVEFMRKSPLVGVKIDLRRKQDFGRDIEL
jgi:antitoxin Phd